MPKKAAKKAKVANAGGECDVLLVSKKIYKPSAALVKDAVVKDWEKARQEADKDSLAYWEEAAKDLVWFKPWTQVLDKSQKPFLKWFTGGQNKFSL